MGKIFKVSGIRKAILFTSGLALATSCHSRQFLRAETIRVDFLGKAISAKDFTKYTKFFNRCYLFKNGTEAQGAKIVAGWEKKVVERMSVLGDGFQEHVDNAMVKVCKKVLRDREKVRKYRNETMETILEREWDEKWDEGLYEEEREKIFSKIVEQEFRDANSVLGEKGCITELDGADEHDSLTFILVNGSISREEYRNLFKGLVVPLKLVFENVSGILTKNRTIKKRAISIVFKNCKLITIDEDCFRQSENLKELCCFQSNIRLEDGAFAECKQFTLNRKETSLVCLPPNSYSKVFEGNLKRQDITRLEASGFCYLVRNSDDPTLFAEYVRCNGMGASALEECYKMFLGEDIQREMEKERKNLKKEFEIREKQCKEIETKNKELVRKNTDLKRVNMNLNNAMEAVTRKNKELKISLEDAKKTCEDKLKEFKQLSDACKNSEQKHTRAMRGIAEKLEKYQNALSDTNERLEKYKVSYNVAKKELEALRLEKEAQKEEIDVLSAFKSKWEVKISEFERLNEIARQSENAQKKGDEAERKLLKERAENKEKLKGKNEEILHLRKELAEARKCLGEAQSKIKELQSSEVHIATVVGCVFSGEEDEKEEGYNAFRPSVTANKKIFKNTNRKGNKGWRDFEYSKGNK